MKYGIRQRISSKESTKMNAKYWFFIVSIVLMGLILGACIPNFFAAPVTSDFDAASTAIAQTITARQTEAFIQTLQAELTRVAQPTQPVNTATPQAPTATAAANTPTSVPPTATNVPPTPVPPTPTATPIPCYWAKFVNDVTVPDGTDYYPGDKFTKTWRLKNYGTCTWASDVDLVFTDGNAMSGPAVVDLNKTVYPGETIDVSVELVAPSTKGSYTGYWMLRSNNGVLFGLGPYQNKAFWVQIDVVKKIEIDPDKPLDFAASYDAATWRSTKGSITPNGNYDYTNGSVLYTSSPKIEKDRQEDEPSLVMIPSDGTGGMISGEYPAVNIKEGDHLMALLACGNDQPKCDAMFQINYSVNGGTTKNLGSWTEAYEGNWTHVDIDLSDLAGKSVKFTLLVSNNGSSKDDRVVWVAPMIVR
jgi:hypothetical protein